MILAKNFPVRQAALTQSSKCIEWFDLEQGPQAQLRQEYTLDFDIDKKGTLNALATFIYIDMGAADPDRRAPRCTSFPYGDSRLPPNTLTSSITSNANSESRAANWANPILILPEPIHTEPGDTIFMTTLADSSTDRTHYTITIRRNSPQGRPLTTISINHDDIYPDFPTCKPKPARANATKTAAATKKKVSKRKRHKTQMSILEPNLTGWPTKTGAAGNGLIAKTAIDRGTMIPILGRISKECILPTHSRSHLYKSDKTNGGYYLDGHPDIQPHRGIGSRGLAIALMANEPTRTSKANAYFSCGYLIIRKNLKAGEEILVVYGRLGARDHAQRRATVGYEVIEDNDINTLIHTHDMPAPGYRKWILNKYMRHCSYIQMEPNMSFATEGAIQGIPNLGNTCHLGAVIQALIPAWNHKDTHLYLPQELQLVVQHALGKTAELGERIKALEHLIEYLRRNRNTAALYPEDGEQEGLHQTYMTLMEGINHPEASMDTITRTSAMICENRACPPSKTYKTHNHLLLDLPDKDETVPLITLIRHTDRDISLEDNTRCGTCGHRGRIRQKWKTRPTGNTIVIHAVPRNRQGNQGLVRTRMNPPFEGLKVGDSPHEYSLQSVVGFTGNNNGGHFFTISRREGDYYLLNDSRATKLTNPKQTIREIEHITMMVYMRRQAGQETSKRKRTVNTTHTPTSRETRERRSSDAPTPGAWNSDANRNPGKHHRGQGTNQTDDAGSTHKSGTTGNATQANQEINERSPNTEVNTILLTTSSQQASSTKPNTSTRPPDTPDQYPGQNSTKENHDEWIEETLTYIKGKHNIQHLGLDGIIDMNKMTNEANNTLAARRMAPRSIQIILINQKLILADKTLGAPVKIYVPDYTITDQGGIYKICKTIYGETDIDISKIQRGCTKKDRYALIIAILIEVITHTEPPEEKTYEIKKLADHLKRHMNAGTKIPLFPSTTPTKNRTPEKTLLSLGAHVPDRTPTEEDADKEFLEYMDSIEKEISLMNEIRGAGHEGEATPTQGGKENDQNNPSHQAPHKKSCLKETILNMANTHRDAQNQPNRTPINYFPDIEQQSRQLLLLNQTINQHILQIKHGDTWHSDTDHHSKLGATVMNKQSYLEGGNTWVNTGNTATREIDLCFKAMKTKTFTRVALIIEENEQNNNNAREHAAKHPETHMYTINTYKPNSATYKQEGTKKPWTLGKTRTNTKTLKLLMIQNRPETTQSLRRLKTQIKKTDGDNHDTLPIPIPNLLQKHPQNSDKLRRQGRPNSPRPRHRPSGHRLTSQPRRSQEPGNG